MAAKTRQPKLPWTEVLPLLRACAGGPSPAKSLMDRHAKALKALGGLLWNDSVLGYGIAEKRTGGIPSGQFSVRFYVRNKVAKSRLRSLWRIPPILQLSHKKSGMPPWKILTDVVSMPEIPRLQRLLSPGQSIGHFSGSEGAIGVVVDGADGRFVLTCAHVAAPPIATAGDSIESPADNDKKPGPNTMGQLHAWFALDSANDNEIDAALIRPDPSPGIQLTN